MPESAPQALEQSTAKAHAKALQDSLAHFTAPIRAEFSNDGAHITLLQGFYYYLASDKEKCILVPPNFKSDGFTNFGLSFIVKRYGKGLKCAILHDYLCEQAHKGECSREYADKVFLEAMRETHAFSACKIWILYLSVRFYAKVKGYK